MRRHWAFVIGHFIGNWILGIGNCSVLASTHQMIALLAALWVLITHPISLGPWVGILAIVAVMIGALTPDLDQPTANIWKKMLGARALGNIFQAFSGGHRHMTHSLIGIIVIVYVLRRAAGELVNPAYYEQAMVLWRAYMIGYISHLIADTLTDRGVPWLWPLRIHIKMPPGPEEVRVTTGSFVETFILRGAIFISAFLLLRSHWSIFLELFQ